jgi:phage tail sheath protein FI
MPTYLTPGVYVEEVPSANKPIEGVSTSIAAFVGLAPGGPVNTPMRISNWTQFAKIFGDPNEPDNGPFMEGAYLAHSVYGFFQNGGTLCWVVRVGDDGGSNGAAARARAALPAAADSGIEAYSAVALEAGRDDIKVEVAEEPSAGDGATETTYRVQVTSGPEKEEFTGLTLKKGRNNLATKVNAQSKLIKIEETGASLPEAQRIPATGVFQLSAPSIEPTKVKPTHFEGDVARRRGMGGLAAVDEITMVVMPDIMTLAAENGDDVQVRDLQGKMIAHCENAGDRMAILDAPPNLLPQEVLEWRMNTAGYDSKFAALYYPWIEVMNPLTNQPMMIPPSGHVAGLWCRTDATRGVHKAPANEVVMGANGLGFQVTQAEQGGLNKVGINCIRAFPGRGIRVWGARTMSSDPEWRYINVRRLFNFVSESIMEGTQWSVFEPNDQKLWIQLRIAATNFLTRVWSDGALFGSTPAQAFYVKCDSETNPPEVIEAGQVICEIGIAPVKPAEFVVFRLSQFSGGEGSAVSE